AGMCEGRETSKQDADEYRRRFYFFFAETMAIRSYVRHFRSSPHQSILQFDHADIQIAEGSQEERLALPAVCIPEDITFWNAIPHGIDWTKDWFQGDQGFDRQAPFAAARAKFNSDTIYTMRYPSSFALSDAQTCNTPSFVNIRNRWVND